MSAIPTLLLSGASDPVTPSASPETRQQNPGEQNIVVPNSGPHRFAIALRRVIVKFVRAGDITICCQRWLRSDLKLPPALFVLRWRRMTMIKSAAWQTVWKCDRRAAFALRSTVRRVTAVNNVSFVARDGEVRLPA